MLLYYSIKEKHRLPFTVLIVLASALINGMLGYFNQKMAFPFFLDSTFTILTAGLLGLWPGIAVGLLSNIVFETLAGWPGYIYPFAIVNVLTALITWFIVSKVGLAGPPQLIWLIILLAFVNALVGAVIVTALFDGMTDQPVDNVVRAIVVTGQSLFSSAFLGRILINVVDKGVGILILYPFYRYFTGKSATAET